MNGLTYCVSEKLCQLCLFLFRWTRLFGQTVAQKFKVYKFATHSLHFMYQKGLTVYNTDRVEPPVVELLIFTNKGLECVNRCQIINIYYILYSGGFNSKVVPTLPQGTLGPLFSQPFELKTPVE